MPRLHKKREAALERMFETRSEAWEAAGLQIEVNRQEARKSAWRLLFLVPALIAVIVLEVLARNHISDLKNGGSHWFVGDAPVTLAAIVCVLVLGWLISRDLSRIAPAFFRRMDPATAGTVEFSIRFISVAVTVLGALAVAGITVGALAVGGAFTAVVLGLAAQQTLGNLFAGMVLLSARPFRVGERVRLQAGVLAGQIDGIVSSLGLLYTTLTRGSGRIMIPNTSVLSAAIVPLLDPEPVSVRVRLGAGVRPSQVQAVLDANIDVPTRNPPRVVLEEIDGEEVIVRVLATPETTSDGARLADEIIGTLIGITREHRTAAADDAHRRSTD